MSIKNRAISLFLAVIMTVSLVVTTSAAVPDFTKTGEINILLADSDDKAVSGGTLTIYKVGDVSEDDGNYSFVLNDDFAGSGESLENIGSASLAERLADYADENRITCETKTIGSDGRVSFDNLELGLYLLVQYKAAYGYYKLNSFLVSVPQIEDDEYVYTVDASPKVEAEDKPTPPPPPGTETETEPDETEPETEPKETEPDTEPEETEPKETEPKETEPEESETEPEETETEPEETETEPEETELDDIGDLGFPELPADASEETELEDIGDLGFPQLPATGQLKWPIPVLVVGGLTLFLIGWVLRFRKKGNNEE